MSSDEESPGVNRASHKALLSEINDIVKFQHIRKPKRSEPAIKNDEFHLVKSRPVSDKDEGDGERKRDKKSISIQSVANVVRKTSEQKKISNQFQETFKQSKVLNKPLEKVHAERVQRSVGYDAVKTKLSRWDAIVTKNKNADQLKFPLLQERASVKSDSVSSGFSQFRYKTQMMKEMEEIHNECFPKAQESEIAEPAPELLTLEEMKERRKELARLKLRESNLITKKRLQGKIKSKKYHRLKKKEELKKKLKEFEELKATNPEAALKELEKIEKERVKERASLRHKNTGSWAKNMKVRAQYDNSAKQELEAQLALGRELTRKDRESESSDSEDDATVPQSANKGNPWLGGETKKEDLDDIFSGYKKFWEQKNANDQALQKLKKGSDNHHSEDTEEEKEMSEGASSEKDEQEEDVSTNDDSDDEGDANPSNFINDLFDAAEEKINSKVDEKLKELKPQLLESFKGKKQRKRKNGADVNDPRYLEFARETRLGDVDEALNEGNESDVQEGRVKPSKRILSEIKVIKKEKKAFMRGTTGEIDPESFLSVKSKHLITALPTTQDFDDADEDELENIQSANKMSLAEAFENDDIINDFIADNEAEVRKAHKEDAGTLPGWGSWGGEGIKKPREKPQKVNVDKRKKDRVIINAKVNDKLRKHLISAVPFPFRTIKDYEASLRFPIGKDFVPSAAHSKLTTSAIVTKAGTIIEPMSEEVLVENENARTIKKRAGGRHFKKTKFH